MLARILQLVARAPLLSTQRPYRCLWTRHLICGRQTSPCTRAADHGCACLSYAFAPPSCWTSLWQTTIVPPVGAPPRCRHVTWVPSPVTTLLATPRLTGFPVSPRRSGQPPGRAASGDGHAAQHAGAGGHLRGRRHRRRAAHRGGGPLVHLQPALGGFHALLLPPAQWAMCCLELRSLACAMGSLCGLEPADTASAAGDVFPSLWQNKPAQQQPQRLLCL
jgi:hypothetical protein